LEISQKSCYAVRLVYYHQTSNTMTEYIKSVQDLGLIVRNRKTNELFVHEFPNRLRFYLTSQGLSAKHEIEKQINHYQVLQYDIVNDYYLERLNIKVYDR